MKVLVTGGAGFIGSHVVDKLLDAGHEPVIFDRIASPWHDAAQARTVRGSLGDLAALERAMAGCEAVMHLAAAADVNEVEKDPIGSEDVNARGTVNVLEAARRAGVDRVVYASTIWVYTGESGQLVDEDTPPGMPKHLYTASKLAGEMYCASYHDLYDLDSTILRFGIPYGPRARPAAVVPAFVGKALNGEALSIAGDGSASRRFVYVEDLAEGCVAALAPEAANRTYNLVSDDSVTIREIAELVQELVAPVDIVYTEGRKGDYVGVEVSGARAEEELGWTASTPFPVGVERYVAARRAELAPKPDTREPAGLAAGARRFAAAALLVLASVALLFVYLAGLTDAGLSNAEARTVGTISLLGVGLYLLAELEWRVTSRLREFLGLVAAIGVALAVLAEFPATRNLLGLAEPTSAVIVLSIAGAALGILVAATGLSLLRGRFGEAASERA